jgi:hypothetical protein
MINVLEAEAFGFAEGNARERKTGKGDTRQAAHDAGPSHRRGFDRLRSARRGMSRGLGSGWQGKCH